MKYGRKLLLLGVIICLISSSLSFAYGAEDEPDYEHNYNLGQFHLVEGQYEAAASYFVEAIQEKPDYYEAYMGLANTLMFAEKFEDLLRVTTEMIAKFPNSSESYKLRAQAYNAYGEYILSKKDLQKAIKIEPNNYSAHMVLGNTYRMMGEYDKAAEAYTVALKDKENREQTYILLGEAHELNQDYGSAMLNFEKALDFNKDSYSARIKIAYIYMVTENYDEAIKYYKEAAEIQASGELYAQIGRVYLMEDDANSAVLAFEKAISITGSDLELMLEVAAGFGEYEEYELALKYLDRGLEIEPENTDYINEVGVVKVRQGFYEEAMEYFTRANALLPGDAVILSNIGSVYDEMKDQENALKYYGDSLLVNPEFEYTLARLRQNANLLENTRGFESLVKRLEEQDKASSLVYEYLIRTLIDNESYDLARDYGITSTGLQKDFKHAIEIGSAFEEADRLVEAKDFYQLARTYGAYSVDELRQMAYDFSAEGKIRQRMECEAYALELDPDNYELLLSLGYFKYHMGESQEAVALFKKAAETDTSNFVPYLMIAEVSAKGGDFKAAVENYDLVMTMNPKFGSQIIKGLKKYDIHLDTMHTADGGVVTVDQFSPGQYVIVFETVARAFSLYENYESQLEYFCLSMAYGSDNALFGITVAYQGMKDAQGLIQVGEYVTENESTLKESVDLSALYSLIASALESIEAYDASDVYYEKAEATGGKK